MHVDLEMAEAAADANARETKDPCFELNQQLGDAVGRRTGCRASSRTQRGNELKFEIYFLLSTFEKT